MGYLKSVLQECPFPENCIGAADNEIQGKLGVTVKKIAFLDQTGVAIERRIDKTQHNWRVDDTKLQDNSTKCTKENPLAFALCEGEDNVK